MKTIGPLAEIHVVKDVDFNPDLVEVLGELARSTDKLLPGSEYGDEWGVELVRANKSWQSVFDTLADTALTFRALRTSTPGEYDILAQLPPTIEDQGRTLYGALYRFTRTDGRREASVEPGRLAVISLASVENGRFRPPEEVNPANVSALTVIRGLATAVSGLAQREATFTGAFHLGVEGYSSVLELPDWLQHETV